MSAPWPPLRSNTGSVEGVERAQDAAFDMQGESWPTPPFPLALRHDVQRGVDAAQRLRPLAGQLGFGQIRALAIPSTDAPALGLLLLQQRDGGATRGRWEGLLVTPDVDYAATNDLVIQVEDGITAPACGVVFAQPRVCCRIDASAPLLGRLHAEAIGRLLSFSPPLASSPIQLGMREASPGVFAVTGVRDPLDPARRQYMSLVEAAVQPLIDAGAPPAPAEARRSPLHWLWSGLAGAAIATAATVIALPMFTSQVDIEGTRGIPTPALTSTPMRTVPALTISPAPDVSVARLSAALQDVNGMVVGGPGDDGRYVVALLSLPPAQAIERLRASGAVESATELPGGAKVAR